MTYARSRRLLASRSPATACSRAACACSTSRRSSRSRRSSATAMPAPPTSKSVVRRWDEGTPGITQGTFMTTPPELLDDIKWFGINMVACANNHAFDYGEGGLLATIRHLDAAGIAHAGSGANLAEARMPGYLDTRGGRVAILATTATFRPVESRRRAAARSARAAGHQSVRLQEHLHGRRRSLRSAQAHQPRARLRAEARAPAPALLQRDRRSPPSARRSSRCSTRRFVRGNGFKVASEGDKADIEDNLRWIKEARRQADWVVFHFHSHEYGHAQPASQPRPRASCPSLPTSRAPSRARRSTPAPTSSSATARTRRSASSSTRASRSSIRSATSIMENETLPFFPADRLRALRPRQRRDAGRLPRCAHRQRQEGPRRARRLLAELRGHLPLSRRQARRDPHPPGRPGLRPPARAARPPGAGERRRWRPRSSSGSTGCRGPTA